MSHKKYMSYALTLARRGAGYVHPNPLVGAVIVKNGKIIGEGYHENYGGLHAERNALKNCRENPEGATLYVTLEPCSHFGKTPPCTEAIIESRIARVVIGSPDPNPLVNGKGVAILKAAGIKVVQNIMLEECQLLNEEFFYFISNQRPFVTMKYAMTMDGKIATESGESQWITGEAAREQVHKDRNIASAIMVGIGTVIKDDPMLTCRFGQGKNPIRIICDTHLKMPEQCRIMETAKQVPTIIATCNTDVARHALYEKAGCQVLVVPEEKGHLDLTALMEELGRQKIASLILEGGGTLNAAALSAGIVNKVQAYIAPKLFGGALAKSPVEGTGVISPSLAYMLTDSKVTMFGEDMLIESRVKQNVHGNH